MVARLDFIEAESLRFSKFVKQSDPLAVYSEGLAYRSFLAPIVEEYASRGHKVAYVTSERGDCDLGWDSPNIENFYVGIGARRTWFFQTLSARVLLLTMPDLETFHLKRSVNPVHYVYSQHSLNSLHMVYREGAFDSYDSIFAAGPHHVAEVRALEKSRGTSKKVVLEQGYALLDQQILKAESFDSSLSSQASGLAAPKQTTVLLAPSWGPDGLIENHGLEVVRVLISAGLRVLFRPHIRTVQLANSIVLDILSEFESHENFVFDASPESFESFLEADVMISAWSGAAFEFAFAYGKPVVSVQVPRKAMNPTWADLGMEPFEERLLKEIGLVVKVTELTSVPNQIMELIAAPPSRERLTDLRTELIFNVGKSKLVAADYLEGLMN